MQRHFNHKNSHTTTTALEKIANIQQNETGVTHTYIQTYTHAHTNTQTHTHTYTDMHAAHSPHLRDAPAAHHIQFVKYVRVAIVQPHSQRSVQHAVP